MRAVGDEGGQVMHTAEPGRLLQGDQEIPHGEPIVPAAPVGLLPATCGDDVEHEIVFDDTGRVNKSSSEEVIDAAEEAGIYILFTGTRHFLH